VCDSWFVPCADVIILIRAGRIWWLRFFMGSDGKWQMNLGLSEHCLPAVPEAVVLIESQRGKTGNLDSSSGGNDAGIAR
jgi:hypothetical protein